MIEFISRVVNGDGLPDSVQVRINSTPYVIERHRKFFAIHNTSDDTVRFVSDDALTATFWMELYNAASSDEVPVGLESASASSPRWICSLSCWVPRRDREDLLDDIRVDRWEGVEAGHSRLKIELLTLKTLAEHTIRPWWQVISSVVGALIALLIYLF